MAKRIIESNILYELQEVDTPGRLAPVQIALATKGGIQFTLTPFAAADLARKLMRWAVFHD
jgi:hypothetical protein